MGRVPNASWITATAAEDRNDTCVYRPGADIDDHAVVTVQYDGGLVATLFFAIFGPWSEDQETLEIVGDSGRLRMERHSGDIDLVEAYGHARSTIRFPNPERGSSHFGADLALVRRLRAFVDGHPPPSAWPRASPRSGWSMPRRSACGRRAAGRSAELPTDAP
ncbi:MAG: hypothetical protein JKP98_15030 [Rhodobacteraceae bacterium]|nr:hypothetical protein [Paracoccaceae bacterium]